MNELKLKRELKPGLTRLVADELDYLKFSILRLEEGKFLEERLAGWECAIILLSGGCDVEVDVKGAVSLGPRTSVFTDAPWGLYVPGNLTYRIQASAASEIVLAYAPWKNSVDPVLVTPAEVQVHDRGQAGYQREVRDIIVDQVEADSLLVGETINRPGQWSSYPPHKHDTEIPGVESRLEEIYFYKVNPTQGFGYQRIYTDDRSLDAAVTVENDDLVLLPRGYHPVAAAPGYSVYYLWALAGPERVMIPHDDPQHKWINTKPD